ncbi:MAG: DUF5606 domain-containing protein [Flavobacteriaceae bacterium]|jgi:hypothetical protein|nr:DUF5606 domain-containing protein [Flavobacteriaceae bacterium]
MLLEKIISISGKPGLFRLISQSKNGFIVEDISSKNKLSVNNSSQVSLLDNISMYASDKEVPLFEIFENIAKNHDYKETISHKSEDKELRKFMSESLPNYDEEKIYISDIKKLAQWYNILHKADFISTESFVKPETETTETEKPENPEEEKKPKKQGIAAQTRNDAKTTAPKVKASSAAKSAPKNLHRKQG